LRKYIKQGLKIGKAFETAGFKNAIMPKTHHKEQDFFSPEDIRYSVIRYGGTHVMRLDQAFLIQNWRNY
jgi:hypothetical protein